MYSSPGSVRVWSSVPGAATATSPLPSPSRSATAATTPPKPPRRSVPFQWYTSLPLAEERLQAPPTIVPSASAATGAPTAAWGHPPPSTSSSRPPYHPVSEEPARRLSVPGAYQLTVPPRPHRGAPAVERSLDLEARAGGDVRVAVAVDVERLAEAEPQLTLWDAPGEAPRDAPAGSGSSAGHRGPGGARERKAGNRAAEESGDGRKSASPARAC